MVAATAVFAVQDGVSRHLASEYNVMMVVMIRYWFFAAFVLALAARAPGGLRATARTTRPVLQAARGLLLAGEICVMVTAFTLLGLVESHAVFAVYPLLTAALSGPLLGERVGWRRWAAIGVGFLGVLVILRPGTRRLLAPGADPADRGGDVRPLQPADAARGADGRHGHQLLLDRHDGRGRGDGGGGFWFVEPMAPADWGWMAALCVSGGDGALAAHPHLRRRRGRHCAALRLSPAGLRLPDRADGWFGEALEANVAWGAAIVVAAGVFTLLRSGAGRYSARQRHPVADEAGGQDAAQREAGHQPQRAAAEPGAQRDPARVGQGRQRQRRRRHGPHLRAEGEVRAHELRERRQVTRDGLRVQRGDQEGAEEDPAGRRQVLRRNVGGPDPGAQAQPDQDHGPGQLHRPERVRRRDERGAATPVADEGEEQGRLGEDSRDAEPGAREADGPGA